MVASRGKPKKLGTKCVGMPLRLPQTSQFESPGFELEVPR